MNTQAKKLVAGDDMVERSASPLLGSFTFRQTSAELGSFSLDESSYDPIGKKQKTSFQTREQSAQATGSVYDDRTDSSKTLHSRINTPMIFPPPPPALVSRVRLAGPAVNLSFGSQNDLLRNKSVAHTIGKPRRLNNVPNHLGHHNLESDNAALTHVDQEKVSLGDATAIFSPKAPPESPLKNKQWSSRRHQQRQVYVHGSKRAHTKKTDSEKISAAARTTPTTDSLRNLIVDQSEASRPNRAALRLPAIYAQVGMSSHNRTTNKASRRSFDITTRINDHRLKGRPTIASLLGANPLAIPPSLERAAKSYETLQEELDAQQKVVIKHIRSYKLDKLLKLKGAIADSSTIKGSLTTR